MKTIKTVGIKDLKNELSAYLREVKAGNTVLITERGQVIAELHEPAELIYSAEKISLQTDWIRAGKLKPPLSMKKPIAASPVKLKAGTALDLLDRERGE